MSDIHVYKMITFSNYDRIKRINDEMERQLVFGRRDNVAILYDVTLHIIKSEVCIHCLGRFKGQLGSFS